MMKYFKQTAARAALVAVAFGQTAPAFAQTTFPVTTGGTTLVQNQVSAPIYDAAPVYTSTETLVDTTYVEEVVTDTVYTDVSQNEIIYVDQPAVSTVQETIYTSAPVYSTPTVTTTSAGLRDFGDAPAFGGYGNPSHLIVDGIQLGALIDGEQGGGTEGALGDDQNGVSAVTGNVFGGDEDGVRLISSATAGVAAVAVAQVQGQGGYLQGWFDWDGNGTFDADEQVATNLQDLDGDGRIEFPIMATEDAGPTVTYARFRWSTQANLGPTDDAPDGEIEDYRYQIGLTPTSNSYAVNTPRTVAVPQPIAQPLPAAVPASVPVAAPIAAPVAAVPVASLPGGLAGVAGPIALGVLGVAAVGAIIAIAADDNSTSTSSTR